jgi:GT2 family glycosyltransferase
MNISFVIVNYMQEAYLDNMLLSISDAFSMKFNITIVIVDNSSSINSRMFFKTHENLLKRMEIKILKNSNTGYLRGLYTGAKQVSNFNNDFVFLCNPDLEFQKCDWLGVLSRYRGSQVLLAPQIITPNGKNQNPNRMKPFSKFEIFVKDISTINYGIYKFITNARKVLKKLSVSVRTVSKQIGKQEIWLPHGSCIIIDFVTLKKSNFFKENTFLWGEEVIISEKARRQGAVVLFEPNLKVLHNEHSATCKIVAKSKFKIWKKSYAIYRTYF